MRGKASKHCSNRVPVLTTKCANGVRRAPHRRYGMQPVFPVLGQAPAVLASHDFLLPPTGGLLNSQHWSVVGSEADLNPDCPQLSVVLATEADEDTLEIWPHDFQATLAVRSRLLTSLDIHAFICPLHAHVTPSATNEQLKVCACTILPPRCIFNPTFPMQAVMHYYAGSSAPSIAMSILPTE